MLFSRKRSSARATGVFMKFYRPLFLSLVVISCFSDFDIHAQITLNPLATRALGAARLEQANPNTITNLQPNLVEGRELNQPQGIALDMTANPPHLYVADTFNNRILAWNNATQFANGAFADLVIGQSDFLTTLQQGPFTGSTRPSSGMYAPMGITVDAYGNLYVIDAGNNRILRFPQPFAQNGSPFPDMVIGQPNFNSRGANAGGVTASTLAFASSSGINQAFLKFDNANNLWVADVLNNRVLRFNSTVLASGASGPSADVVLGQPDFSSNSATQAFDPTSTSMLRSPTGIAFDNTGRLYVSESQPPSGTTAIRSRILIYSPPFASNEAAGRIIGTVAANNPVQPPVISESQLGAGATGLFTINNAIAIADTSNNRILIYPPFQQFTSDTLTQKAQVVIGQADFNSGKPNRANADASNNTLQLPSDAAFSGTELYIADAGNSRVIVMPIATNSSTLAFNNATRELGQPQFSETAPNYLSGREFHFSDDTGEADAGIALDNNSNPPHLYVADTYNNRILCFVDYRLVKTGATADFVIGQQDLTRSVINYPTGSANTPTQQGLYHPTGLAVDSSGNLYVADRDNSRVIRFPAPFAQPSKQTQSADLVLGQGNFTSKTVDVAATRMYAPYGLAFAPNTGLLVSDQGDNRVLLFAGTSFTSGMAATKVWGQPGFSTATSGSADNRFNAPHGIAVDSSQRLYVADAGNNRILIFDDVRQAGADPHSLVTVAGLSQSAGGSLSVPRSVFIDPSDEIWIGDSNRALRFSGGYNSLFTTNFTPDEVIPEVAALALALDANGALYVGDFANRVVVHYPGLSALNGASFNTSRLTVAPNTILSLFSLGSQFGAGLQSFSTLPLPTTMQAIQVLLNGTPAPLFYVSPSQINLLIPNNAPTSGTADLQVIRTDNGQTLGDTTINMTTVAPGLFTASGTGNGQAAAINDDGTYNGATNPISRGHVLQVFGTGLGNIPGAPNDGSAVSAATPTTESATAIIGGIACPVQYSGLAPGLVGVWQVNVYVATGVVPTTSQPNRTSELIVFLGGTPSGGSALYGIQTTVWIKQ